MVDGMSNKSSVTQKLLIIIGLLAATGLILFQSGLGLLAILLSISGLTVTLCSSCRKPGQKIS